MDVERAAQALADYLDLPLVRHRHRMLLARVLELRDNFTAYNAAYVALAEELQAEIITTDEPFARSLRTLGTLTVVAP